RSVVAFREKEAQVRTAPAWLNGGAYVIEQSLFEHVPPGEPCSLEREIFPRVLAAGQRLAAMTSDEPFFDIGTPDDLERFRRVYLNRTRNRTPQVSYATRLIP